MTTQWMENLFAHWHIIAVLLTAILLSACGAARGSSSAPQAAPYPAAMDQSASLESQLEMGTGMSATTAAAAAEAPMLTSGRYTGESDNNAAQPEKIIKTGNVSLTTENFDSDKARLETLTRQMGGFVESSNVYNTGASRRYTATLRVPGDRFADLKKAAEQTGKLVSSDESEQNVTSQYYDAQGRLASKRIEEERVLKMIGETDNVDTLLSLEEYLGRLRTDIDVLESQIKDIDSLSSYSTLNVSMAEGVNVKVLANAGNFGQRLWQSFKASASGTGAFFGNVVVFLAGAAIPLLLIALVVFTGIGAYRRLRMGNRKERASQ